MILKIGEMNLGEMNLGEVHLEFEFRDSATKKHPFLVLLHPHPRYGGSMENKIVDQIFRRSEEFGFGCLRYNSRGVGKSSGEFNQGVGEVQDLLGILNDLKEEKEIHGERISVVGYSFGAYVVALALEKGGYVARSIYIAPPVSFPNFPKSLLKDHLKIILAAEKDEICPIEDVQSWFKSLSDPKKISRISGADHFFVGKTTKLVRELLEELS